VTRVGPTGTSDRCATIYQATTANGNAATLIAALHWDIDKDVTKTAEDRRVVLYPRATAVLERQLDLRQQMLRRGAIRHEHLFFTADSEPIQRLSSLPRRSRRRGRNATTKSLAADLPIEDLARITTT
jgi:hypothetical protein